MNTARHYSGRYSKEWNRKQKTRKRENISKWDKETSSACRYTLEEEKITKLSLKHHCNLSRDLNAYVKNDYVHQNHKSNILILIQIKKYYSGTEEECIPFQCHDTLTQTERPTCRPGVVYLRLGRENTVPPTVYCCTG